MPNVSVTDTDMEPDDITCSLFCVILSWFYFLIVYLLRLFSTSCDR